MPEKFGIGAACGPGCWASAADNVMIMAETTAITSESIWPVHLAMLIMIPP
jgi:hypothetical protein